MEKFRIEKLYFAWTRGHNQSQWIQTVIRAVDIKEARQKLSDQGREIEKGSLCRSKYRS